MDIKQEDITILIQGPFHPDLTLASFSSVKRLLPKSELIFSTWQGSEIPKLEFMPDTILYNPLPDSDIYGNFNRQLFSTSEGLKIVKTKYVLKMRSDFVLDNLNMLDFFHAEAPRESKIFEQRIVAYVWKPKNKKYNPRLFHPGDFYYFGLTSDLKNLFSISPIQPEEKIVYPSSELYLWVKFLKAIDVVKFSQDDLFNYEKKDYFNKILADNFVFVSYAQMGIRTLKDALKKNNISTSNTAFSFEDWLKISKSKQSRKDFPYPKITITELSRDCIIKFMARMLQLVYFDKKKRREARIKLYKYL